MMNVMLQSSSCLNCLHSCLLLEGFEVLCLLQLHGLPLMREALLKATKEHWVPVGDLL
jgi:hypothetical protein